MRRAINFFHNNNSILSSHDEIFYKKTRDGWEEVKNTNVYKETDYPAELLGNDDDYYIYYNEIGNHLAYSNSFNKGSWLNIENTLEKNDAPYFLNSQSTKMIPSMNISEHSIHTSWSNPIISSIPYWCFSIYVKFNELQCIELVISDNDETQGLKARFSLELEGRVYKPHKSFEIFGATSEEIHYDNDCYGMDLDENGFYRIHLSGQFLTIPQLQGKIRILKKINGIYQEEFANINQYACLYIADAQLNKGKSPNLYVESGDNPTYYLVFNRLYHKENNIWKALDNTNMVWYGNDLPKENLGSVDDIYFVNPIITLSSPVRFGTNDSMEMEDGIIFWYKKKDTYGYITNGEIREIKTDNSIYKFTEVLNALTFSTNLFNQSYSSKYGSNFAQRQMGFNTGGNYNFWDYNNLRKYH